MFDTATNKDFERNVSDPIQWMNMAIKHLHVAKHCGDEFFNQRKIRPKLTEDDLLKEMAFLESKMIHLGFCVENAIKAAFIKLNPDKLSDTRIPIWGGGKGGHNLTGLLSEIDSELSDQYEDMLFRFETFILWAGRYPTPVTVDKYLEAVKKKLISMTTSDVSRTEKLLQTLKNIIND